MSAYPTTEAEEDAARDYAEALWKREPTEMHRKLMDACDNSNSAGLAWAWSLMKAGKATKDV